MTNPASDLSKASLAGFSPGAGCAERAVKAVAPQGEAVAGAALLDALKLGRSALDQPAPTKLGARGVHIGVPAAAPRQNPPEVVPPPPTPPVAIPLRVAISPVAADGETSGANLAMRCAPQIAARKRCLRTRSLRLHLRLTLALWPHAFGLAAPYFGTHRSHQPSNSRLPCAHSLLRHFLLTRSPPTQRA